MTETVVEPKLPKRRADRLRQEAFVAAYITPTSPTYLRPAQAAIAAGYKPKQAASQASRLLKGARIKGLIDSKMIEMADKLTSEKVIDVAFVERQHLEAMARCRIAGDRTNEREHLECIGKMKGAYDTSLHVDLTVKHEYDERLAVEASRMAAMLIEAAGVGGLGLPAGRAVEASAPATMPVALADTIPTHGFSANAPELVPEVEGKVPRVRIRRECAVGALDAVALEALADHDGDGHDQAPTSDNAIVCCAPPATALAPEWVEQADGIGIPQVVGERGEAERFSGDPLPPLTGGVE